MKPITRSALLLLSIACGVTGAAHDIDQKNESVTPRIQVAISNLPGESFTSAIVDFPPGAKAVPHRHGEAFVYAYVLSGSIRSQLDEQPAKIYRTGQDWYEAPGAHHKLTENTSKTASARLLVIFISPAGTPLKTPD